MKLDAMQISKQVLLPLITACLATLVSAPTHAQAPSSAKRVVVLPLENGEVDCAQLFHSISGELHWVAGSMTAFTRVFGIQADGNQRLSAEQVDDLVHRFPQVFSYRPTPAAEPAIESSSSGGTRPPSPTRLAVDVSELSKMLANKKSALRKWLAGIQDQPLSTLDPVAGTWPDTAERPPRIVVLLAGFHSLATTAEAVGKQLHAQTNLPMSVFAYPNDAPIEESARLLNAALLRLHRTYPDSRVTLVTHSMGGLVARAALEAPAPVQAVASSARAAPMGVDQLIQVCPPNHGSALAQYGPLLEGAEQVFRIFHRSEGGRSRKLFAAIVDGFNEASTDLQPNSPFLTELNQRDRNPLVRYTILAGNDGPLRSRATQLMANVWNRIALSVDEPAEVDERIREILTCAELQQGQGDGVVSLQSAKLPGVVDVQVLSMHHLVWNELDSDAGKQMLQAISQRLGISL